MSYKVSVVVEQDEHGFFAYVPELKGCHSQGDSLDEAMRNMKEALELYMETSHPKIVKQIMEAIDWKGFQ